MLFYSMQVQLHAARLASTTVSTRRSVPGQVAGLGSLCMSCRIGTPRQACEVITFPDNCNHLSHSLARFRCDECVVSRSTAISVPSLGGRPHRHSQAVRQGYTHRGRRHPTISWLHARSCVSQPHWPRGIKDALYAPPGVRQASVEDSMCVTLQGAQERCTTSKCPRGWLHQCILASVTSNHVIPIRTRERGHGILHAGPANHDNATIIS